MSSGGAVVLAGLAHVRPRGDGGPHLDLAVRFDLRLLRDGVLAPRARVTSVPTLGVVAASSVASETKACSLAM